MNKITSLNNPLIKQASSLQSKKSRDENNMFIIEGLKVLNEALSSKLNIKFILCNKDFDTDRLVKNNINDIYFLSENCLKKVCTTDSPVEVLAIAEKTPLCYIETLLNNKNKEKLVVILDNITDPGNLGTIIRTCCAANVDGIILTTSSVDLFNPKVVRSATGNLWKIPIAISNSTEELINCLKLYKYNVLASDVTAVSKYYNSKYNGNTAIIFGSEAHGVSKSYINNSDSLIKIPISPHVESLNVASSVAIIVFEACRQRSTHL